MAGARESNAGDEFHVLWAARRAVDLLSRSSTLSRLFVEKIAAEDDPSGDDRLLTADIAEYHGGDTFPTADRVDVFQLKYSTRAPGKPWTAARLAEGAEVGKGTQRSRGRNTSLIKRLSDAVAFAVEKEGADWALRRFRVRLVSNQPVAPILFAALSAGATIAVGPNVAMAHVLRRVEDDDHRETLERLWRASDQRSRTFAVFLRCLDLSGCGSEPRALLKTRLTGKLSPYAPANPRSAARSLVDLVHNEALPEGEESAGLVATDVLAALGASSERVLFPAPPRFEVSDEPIDTGDALRAARAVIEAEGKPVVIHGDAGVGKTTTGLMMDRHLPVGSELIAYDCFGGGDYLNAGDQRHTERRALRQLTNELARRCGTPFLVVDDLDLPDLERRFRESLDSAAEAVRNRGGLLVLLIDAADNAVYASRLDGDCVVPRLWATPMPEGARLVMSARTHRLALLEPPSEAIDVELSGFDETASRVHLRRVFPEATAEQGLDFHEATEGNPRVQSYVLEAGDIHIDDALARSERTPEDLFEEIYQAAVDHAQDDEKALAHAAALLALVRPGGLDTFASSEGLALEEAEMFCRGLVPGARLEAQEGTVEVAFRDEDFERFLADRVGEARVEEAHGRYATWGLARMGTDAHAARAVADHLFASGRTDELVDLVLRDESPLAIEDDVARLEVRQRRARLALRAVEDRPEDGVRVVLLLAEMARERGGFAGVVHQAPGLAVRYADADAVGRLFLREERDARWLGPAHLHAAAVMSADPTADSVARSHLDAAHAWVRRWMREGRDQGWTVGNDDIVNEIVAVHRLNGPKAAADQAFRWSPVTLLPEVAYGVGAQLGPTLTGATLSIAIRDADLPSLGKAATIAGAWSEGGDVERDLVSETASDLVRASRSGRRREAWGGAWAVDFAEAMASHRLGDVRHVLDVFGPETGRHYDVFGGAGRLHLRQRALLAALDGRSLALIDVLPESLRYLAEDGVASTQTETSSATPQDDDEREAEERRRADYRLWRERAGPLLPVASVRALALVGSLSPDDLRGRLEDALKAWGSRERRYYREVDARWTQWCEMAIEASGFAGAPPDALTWLDEKVAASDAGEPGRVRLAMAQRAARWESYAALALDWVGKAVRWSADRDGPVVERRDLLLWAAQIALPLDEPYGRDLYLQALDAASELDDEGAILLTTHARLVEATACEFGTSEARALAARLPASVDALAPKVSNRDPLPYVETVRAALALSLDRGLATWGRWADDGSMGLWRPGAPAVEVASRGRLEPEEALALLRATDTLTASAAVRTMDWFEGGEKDRRVRAFERVTTWVLRDEPTLARAKAAAELLQSAEDDADLLGAAERLRQVVSFAGEDVQDAHALPPGVTHRGRDADEEAQYADEAREVSEAVEAALADARHGRFETLDERLSTATRGRARIGIDAFVDRIATAVRPSDRVRFLRAVVEGTASSSFARFQAAGTADTVIRWLDAWRDSRAVRESRSVLGELIVQKHLPALMGYWGEPRRAFDAVLRLIPESRRIPTLAGAIPLHLPDLGVYDLYGVFEALALLLPVDARSRVLSESLARRERATGSGNELPDRDPEAEPDPISSLALFFRGLFGDRDRRVRWRALHAAYEMLVDLPADRAQRVVRHLLETVDRADPGGHRSEERLFLWLSSRVSVFQLLLRLAHGAPPLLAPFAPRLADEAENRKLPHVVARELARRASLHLIDVGEAQLDDERIERLRAANQPMSCLMERDERQPGTSRHNYPPDHSWDEDEFGFGLIDEVGEWYPQLEACLDVDWGEVFQRAKRWVMDEWGFREDLWWEEVHESSVPYARDESRVDRGSLPPVEGSRPYAEYHAMMMAAGELVDEGVACVRRPYFDPTDDPWWDWLADHLPLRNDVWTAEWLSETPREDELWGRTGPLDTWLDTPDPEAFDAALSLESGWESTSLPEWLTVRMAVDVVDPERSGDTVIRSALVTTESADALVRSFLDAGERGWALPDEDAPDVMNSVQTPGYELSGWLSWWSPEHEGLDKHDPLRRKAGRAVPAPGPRATRVLGLTRGAHVWTDQEGARAFRFVRWSDDPDERHRVSTPYSKGYRFQARRGPLLRMLRDLDRALLIDVTIARNESYERRKDQKKGGRPYDLGRSRLYLLRGDGTLTRCEPEAETGP